LSLGLPRRTLRVQAAARFSFAILVLTPDDLVQKRSAIRNSPRDNVLFELGLFMGALGRRRTYIVYCRDVQIDLPTDLAGVTAATFAQRSDGNLQAALGPVCTQIKAAIRAAAGVAAEHSHPRQQGEIVKLSNDMASLRAELVAQTQSIRWLMQAITSAPSGEPPATGPITSRTTSDLLALQGVWKNVESDSVAYVRVINGVLRWPYCYGGDHELTAEYYDWRLIDGALIGRFRWFNRPISGYAYLRIESNDRITGGWIMSDEVPDEILQNLPHEQMVPAVWVRQRVDARAPEWVEQYYHRLGAEVMPR
jgi:Predicted nucleotide-binding protein containing TIR-like domain